MRACADGKASWSIRPSSVSVVAAPDHEMDRILVDQAVEEGLVG
jgi:hypothetical protein